MSATTEVRERPILFSAPMVRAILDGRKTQTRRVITRTLGEDVDLAAVQHSCPFGQPGDRLWVRESWRALNRFNGIPAQIGSLVAYAADPLVGDDRDPIPVGRMGKVRSSIHMPRWASRITLEVTGVRVERIQDISVADCECEGTSEDAAARLIFSQENDAPWRLAYRNLWNSINAKRGYGWEVNPWVWVVEFKRLADSAEVPA